MMNFTGETWARILDVMKKTSGKELAISAAPILLAIPGFLDEIGAGIIAVGLVAVFLLLRWQISNNQAEIERRLLESLNQGVLSQDQFSVATHNLTELSTPH